MSKEKRALINTTKQILENSAAGDLVVEAMVMGSGEAILHQEAQGQCSFVGSDTLPTNIYDGKTTLEAMGVKFLGLVDGDPMFQYVELPQGWKKVPTDHPMWSKLVDDKGRERASIFYKAAFYGRSAHMSLTCRYGVAFDNDRFDKENISIANITDGGKVVHTTEPIPANGEKRYDVSAKANKSAVEWLDKKYPKWRNPDAYWD